MVVLGVVLRVVVVGVVLWVVVAALPVVLVVVGEISSGVIVIAVVHVEGISSVLRECGDTVVLVVGGDIGVSHCSMSFSQSTRSGSSQNCVHEM